MRKTIIIGVALSATAGIAYAAGAALSGPDISTLNPAVMKYVLPDKIPWEVTPGLDTAYLYGHPSKPGFYVLMFKWKPGNSSHPHYHSTDRHIVVMSGTWWVGAGTNWDPEHATAAVKPGSYVTHYARQVHYDGARKDDEAAVELVWGEGPVVTVVCDGPNAEKGPGPCEDARKASAK
jgi:quercetin dioxygenase-like cupin family protein